MLKLFRFYKEVSKLITLANTIGKDFDEKSPKWSFFLTNRSFLVPAIGILVNILIMSSVPFSGVILGSLSGISHEVLAEHVVIAITALTFLWSMVERMLGKTRVLWNKTQGVRAVEEALTHNPNISEDKLTQALRNIGLKV